jgi:hypothetical protein
MGFAREEYLQIERRIKLNNVNKMVDVAKKCENGVKRLTIAAISFCKKNK